MAGRPRSIDSFDELLSMAWRTGYVPRRVLSADAIYESSVIRQRTMRWLFDTFGGSHFLAWAAEHVTAEEWRRAKTRLRVKQLRERGGGRPTEEQARQKMLDARISRAIDRAYVVRRECGWPRELRHYIPLLLEHAPADLMPYVRDVAKRLAAGDAVLARYQEATIALRVRAG